MEQSTHFEFQQPDRFPTQLIAVESAGDCGRFYRSVDPTYPRASSWPLHAVPVDERSGTVIPTVSAIKQEYLFPDHLGRFQCNHHYYYFSPSESLRPAVPAGNGSEAALTPIMVELLGAKL
jgi:hypothetical protein